MILLRTSGLSQGHAPLSPSFKLDRLLKSEQAPVAGYTNTKAVIGTPNTTEVLRKACQCFVACPNPNRNVEVDAGQFGARAKSHSDACWNIKIFLTVYKVHVRTTLISHLLIKICLSHSIIRTSPYIIATSSCDLPCLAPSYLI